MFILILVAVLTVLILYTFHLNINPRHFPKGPLSLPYIGSLYILGTEPHKKLIPLKKKYGKVFRIDFGSLRGIILSDHQAIKDAFALQAFTDRPVYDVIENIRGKNYNSGLIWGRGNIYDEQRHFTIKNLKSFGFGKSAMEEEMLIYLKSFFASFDKKIGEPIINTHLFNTLSVKAVWKIVTGELANDENVEFAAAVEAVNEAVSAASSAGGALFFPGLWKLFPNLSGWNSVITNYLKFGKFTTKAIDAHKKSLYSDEPRDFIEAYLQKIKATTEEQSSFFGEKGDGHLKSVVGDLFFTGTETVATALTWVLLLLISNPDAQEKIQTEIDSVIGKERLPSLSDRHKMLFTECFFHEVLRYSGFVPLASPHIASEDVNFYGYFIPKGTIVVPSIYGVLHDPELWDQPEMFRPERFLAEDGTCIDKNKAYLCSFIFGSGKRGCIGETIARDEIFLYATGLCQRYTFSEDPKEKLIEGTKLGITLVPKPHSMIVRKRQ